MTTIIEPEREIEVKGTYDVIVCGGGPAGVAAAVASARAGARTLLLEVNGCLGGIWTAGLLPWILDHNDKQGLMREWREALLESGAANYPPHSKSLACDVESMKLHLERQCLEAGADILLHCRVVAAATSDGAIGQVITESKSGREAWSASVFVDATGDGDLSAFAGCEFDFGDEQGATQPMSMTALITGISLPEVTCYLNGYHTGPWGTEKALLKAEMARAGVEPSYAFPSIVHVKDDLFLLGANHQYKVSALSAADITRASLESRHEVNKLVAALRSLGGVWKNLQLVATSEQIGIREGRRIKGLYELKVDDLLAGRQFDDAICKCRFGIDVHSPDPDETKGISSQGKFKTRPYDIPLRALISKDISNLLMAGRCISGDFLAHSSYRVTGNAVPMGEAAGRVAAECALKRISLQEYPLRLHPAAPR
jgi:hypothetical protein